MKRLLLAAAVLSVATAPAVAMPPLCDVADDPCVVDRDVEIDEATLDLGGRALVVASGRTITIGTRLDLTTGAVTLAPNARIALPHDGQLVVRAAADVRLEAGSAIIAATAVRSTIEIASAWSIVMRGTIRANAASRDGEGGLVFLEAGRRVEVAGGGIQAHGGNRFGAGGWIVIDAYDDATVSMPVGGRGGEGGGAFVDVVGDDVVIGPAATMDTSAVAAGPGGQVSLLSYDDLVATGEIRAVGAGAGGTGGDVDLGGVDVVVGSVIDVSGAGFESGAGQVSMLSEGDLAFTGRIVGLADAATGFGASVDAFVFGTMTVAGPIDIGRGLGATLIADVRTLRIAAPITVAGELRIFACSIEIAPEGVVALTQSLGGNGAALRAASAVTIAGTLRTPTPAVIEWGGTPPVITPEARIDPPPLIVEDPGLFPCPGVCGDGFVDADEECDDGNRLEGDCCGFFCTVEPAGNACDDGRTCTTGGVCDDAGRCTSEPVVCDACEQCVESAGCVTGPKPGCHPILVPGGALLDLKNAAVDAADRLTWRWRLGAATSIEAFGDPLASTDYALCMYDGSDLLMRLRAPHGGAWRRAGARGFRHADATSRMTLLAGDAGASSIVVKGRGPGLAMLPLGLDGPVWVQLEASTGACWTSTFPTPSANVPQRFKARTD
jgi:cysteine-rich repeat protein